MRNIKLLIEYEGTNYRGWQTQKSRPQAIDYRLQTIQQTLEKILRRVLREKIKLIGAGRTDAGVHALGQVANFKTNSRLKTVKIQYALNGLLPKDIVVKDAREVSQDFHSRYNAKSKTYRYIILQGISRLSIDRNFFYYIPYKLNVDKMRKAAQFSKGRHDFRSFCASGSGVKDTIRTIKKLSIKISRSNFLNTLPFGYRFLILDIEADGFLYNMVRNIVGTLIEVGRGRLSPGSIKSIIKSRDRKNAGPTAAATGLTLLKINY